MCSSSNEEKSLFNIEKMTNLHKNDSESQEEENSEINRVEKLLSGLKFSKDPLILEKMDISEIKELSENSTEFGSKNFLYAGKIISILQKIPVVLVKPSSIDNTLLNIGTNLFFLNSKPEIFDNANWMPLGQIEEIFGNVKDPFYAVRLFRFENNFPKMEDKVYFLSNHSSTSLFHVESKTNNKYRIIYHC